MERKIWLVGEWLEKRHQSAAFEKGHFWNGGRNKDISNIKQIHVGDILVAKSNNRRNRTISVYGIGVVVSDVKETGKDWFRCDVTWTPDLWKSPRMFAGEAYKRCVDVGYSTCQECPKAMVELLEFVGSHLPPKGNTVLEKKEIGLIETNRNIVLHGAPGTGKTYLAKEIAKQLIFGKEIPKVEYDKWTDEQKAKWNEQFGFVQFHQSYDYTDFVEGLRPVQENGGGIGFERKDGVFKEFCKAALAKRKCGGVDNFGECFDKLLKMIGDLDDGDALEIPKRVKDGTFRVALNAGGDGLVYACLEDGKYVVREREGRYFNRNQCYNVYRGMPGMPSGALDSYMKAIVDYMKTNKDIGLEEYKPGEDDKSGEASRKFVFVIDEINRGEMSKIFGELFYCIEPDYRGPEHKIKTQYQNLVPPGDDFKEGFFIPENVYIIGTMNDIDRSVESMDFAMRRRFAFKEVTANDTCEAMFKDGKDWKKGEGKTVDVSSCLDEIKMRMQALNEAICPESADKSERKRTGLTRAYHIGGAYFLKFAKYFTGGNAEEAFQALWDNHLEGLLREYLRGMDDARESKLRELKAAYSGETKVAEQKVAADSAD